MQVIDLHCDLLSYLEDDNKNTPLDDISNCSIPQLKKGHILLQALAVYTETKNGSSKSGYNQIDVFKTIIQNYPDFHFPIETLNNDKINVLLSIENLSSIISESDDLDKSIKTFENKLQEISPILSISLTWNEENRFGGGNLSNIGLKKDGKTFLNWMDKKNIAIDLSHTSDHLALDILNYIEQNNLSIIPIASHSNFRKVCNHKRNLSDEIANAIIQKNGLIGINLFKHFIGSDISDLINHLQHAQKLNAQNNLCFGADFFADINLDDHVYLKPFYFKNFENSSCYPRIFDLLKDEFEISFLEKLFSKNAYEFIKKTVLIEAIN